MKTSDKKMTYDAAIAELEQIAGRIQSPDCEVDSLCELTARSVELLRFCREKLTRTDKELARLLDSIDEEAPEC